MVPSPTKGAKCSKYTTNRQRGIQLNLSKTEALNEITFNKQQKARGDVHCLKINRSMMY